jgi:hypothetical protein
MLNDFPILIVRGASPCQPKAIEGTKMKHNPVAVARASYRAYVDKDHAAIEALIADDFHFTSPLSHALVA